MTRREGMAKATLLSNEARRLRAKAYATPDTEPRREVLEVARLLSERARRMASSAMRDLEASDRAHARAALMLDEARRMKAYASAAIEEARRIRSRLDSRVAGASGRDVSPHTGGADCRFGPRSDLAALTEL